MSHGRGGGGGRLFALVPYMEPTRPIEDAVRLLYLRGCSRGVLTLLDSALLYINAEIDDWMATYTVGNNEE